MEHQTKGGGQGGTGATNTGSGGGGDGQFSPGGDGGTGASGKVLIKEPSGGFLASGVWSLKAQFHYKNKGTGLVKSILLI